MAKLIEEVMKDLRTVLHPLGYQMIHKSEFPHEGTKIYTHKKTGQFVIVHSNGQWHHINSSGMHKSGMTSDALKNYLR
jgi:hypothetical protein